MKRTAIISCVALTAALTITACKKDKKEDKADPAAETPPTETTTAEKPTEPTPPPTETAPPPTEPAAPARPASVTDEQVKAVDDFIVSLESVATAAEGAKGDCKAMGKAVTAEAKKMKDLMKKLEAMKTANEKDTAAKDWFKATYEAKMMGSFGKLMSAIEPCKADKAVMDALKSIGPQKKEAAPAPSK
jgi:hypothetical protein